MIASNARSGPFPLLNGRRWDGSCARREAPGGVGAFALCAMEGVIASNACSGPFPLLNGRDWDGSFARREARGS